MRTSTPKLLPSVSQLNFTVHESMYHTQVRHLLKRAHKLCLCLSFEWVCGNCCIFTVKNKCLWFCLVATGKIRCAVFMHWPSRMKHTELGSPCCCFSQNLVGVQTLAGILIPREKDGPRCLQTPLSFRRWADGWQNHVMTILFSAALIWMCWLPSAPRNFMKHLIIQLYSAWAIKPHTSSGINWFWKLAAGLKVTIKLQEWEPDSIAECTEWVWTFGRPSMGASCC